MFNGCGDLFWFVGLPFVVCWVFGVGESGILSGGDEGNLSGDESGVTERNPGHGRRRMGEADKAVWPFVEDLGGEETEGVI